jgi:protein ImuB
VEVASFDGELAPVRETSAATLGAPIVRLALRALRPPLPVEVFERAGCIRYIRGSDFGGYVMRRAGPWRLRGEWWTSEPYAREYYDVELDDGGMYRIYRDVRSQRWLADGVYD